MCDTARTAELFRRALDRVTATAALSGHEADASPSAGTRPRARKEGNHLSATQLEALRFVATHPGCHVKDVADGLRVSPPAATKLIDRLVARRVLARRPGVKDRREVVLSPTHQGQRTLAAVRQAGSVALATILHRMSADDRNALETGLDAFLRAAVRSEAEAAEICRSCGTEHVPACPLERIRHHLAACGSPAGGGESERGSREERS